MVDSSCEPGTNRRRHRLCFASPIVSVRPKTGCRQDKHRRVRSRETFHNLRVIVNDNGEGLTRQVLREQGSGGAGLSGLVARRLRSRHGSEMLTR